MKKVVLVIFTLVSFAAKSQNFISYVEEDTSESKFNKHVASMYFGINGYIPSDKETMAEKQNLGITIGLGYEYKFSKIAGLGINLEYINTLLNVNRDSLTGFPIDSKHDKYQYSFSGISLRSGLNIHIPRNKCASSILFTVRFYGFGDLYLSKKLTVSGKYNQDNSPFAKEYSTTYNGLSYVNTVSYGAGVEISKFSITMGLKYYLSDMFDNEFVKLHSWPQLPKFKVYLNFLY